jgi:voltage-gated potassium channel
MAEAADLAGVPLFASLNAEERSQLADAFEVRSIGEGATLTHEGASGYSFYILLDGDAVVEAGDETVASLSRGDFFGEMAILGDGRRNATVTTTSPARILVMFGTEFRRLQQQHPEIAQLLEDETERRGRELRPVGPD